MNSSRIYVTLSWSLVYLGIAAVGFAVLALKRFDIPPFGELSGLLLVTVLVAIFTAVSLLYWWTQSRDEADTDDDTR